MSTKSFVGRLGELLVVSESRYTKFMSPPTNVGTELSTVSKDSRRRPLVMKASLLDPETK